MNSKECCCNKQKSCTGHGHEHHHDHHSHEHHEHEEQGELSLKALIFAGCLYFLGIVVEHLPLENWIGLSQTIHEAVVLVLYFLAYIITGKNVILGAVKNILNGDFMDEAFLMTISSIGAIILGKVEEATAIMVLYQVGEKFEDYAVDKSRNSIEEIAKLRPDHATIKMENGTKEVSPDDVDTDSIIIANPG